MNSENPKSAALPAESGRFKSIITQKSTRKPLGDLSENITQNKIIRTSVSSTKSVRIVQTKTRSVSASEVEKKVNYCLKSEKVTKRQNEDRDYCETDEVFVEGEKHYLNYLPENEVEGNCKDVNGQIPKPLPVVKVIRASGDVTDLKKPARKVSLVRKLSNRHKNCDVGEFFENSYYSEEYFEDNFNYILKKERRCIFRKDYLIRYADDDHRKLVVNWMNYVQQLLDFTEEIYFIGVRMFDYLLISFKISCDKYVLIGLVCLWIANKFLGVHFIQVPKLFAICNGKFSSQQILSTEREILTILKFRINFPEPASFLFYFLKQQNLETDSKLRNCAMFLLEVFTLLLDFSSLAPSFLACVSLYISLIKFEMESITLLDYVGTYICDKELFLQKSKQMEECVKQILACKKVCNEILSKYSTEEKCFVTLYFTNKQF